MGRSYCCVPGCFNDERKIKSLNWHAIPKDEKRRKQWITNIRRDPGKISPHTRVCSAHFRPTDYRPRLHSKKRNLKDDAVPIIFPWTEEPKILTPAPAVASETAEFGQKCKEEGMETCPDVVSTRQWFGENGETCVKNEVSVDKLKTENENIDEPQASYNNMSSTDDMEYILPDLNPEQLCTIKNIKEELPDTYEKEVSDITTELEISDNKESEKSYDVPKERTKYTIQRKLEIIDWHKQTGSSIDCTSTVFKLHRRNLRSWLKKESILRLNQVARHGKQLIKGSGRKTLSEKLDLTLFEFLVKETETGRAVNNKLLAVEARNIAKQIGLLNFQASDCFINNWKHRHNITMRKVQMTSKRPGGAC